MASATLTLEAWVLGKRPPSDAFQTLTIFSIAHGATLALQRLSRKATPVDALDLFDEASLLIDEPLAGQASFIKEARVLTRLTNIGQSYENLRRASAFASLVARNPVGTESRAAVYELLRRAFHAFAEGYPLKQAWAPSLAPRDQSALVELLNQPMAGQQADPKTVARLERLLEDYLRGETEILLD